MPDPNSPRSEPEFGPGRTHDDPSLVPDPAAAAPLLHLIVAVGGLESFLGVGRRRHDFFASGLGDFLGYLA